MAHWIGYMVSVDTDKRETYQGEISTASETEITLIKPFCNGIPCANHMITLRAENIVNLQLIEKQQGAAGQSTVTVAKPIPKRLGRTSSVSETVVHASKPNTQNASSSFNKSKPIDIEVKYSSTESNSFKSGTPNKSNRKGKWSKSWKDDLCFGSPIDQLVIDKDFDFEKNLALFDKRAIWDEINAQKPDIVCQADQSHKYGSKYRHDENVLTSTPTNFRQIIVPKQEFCEYVTDEGLIIPSISRFLRNRLWAFADHVGLNWEKRVELMGRAATEMSLQLIGGGHRLNPHNSHQCPTIVILCGPHRQGAIGINTARHLASHGVNTVVYVTQITAADLKQELELYKLTKKPLISSVSKLPQLVDLIISCLCDDSDVPKLYTDLAKWTNGNKAPVIALDPPAVGTPGIIIKFSLVPVLPLAHSPDNGKIYLCNLGFPIQIYNEVGIQYKSPFGSKFVIPLHPNDGA